MEKFQKRLGDARAQAKVEAKAAGPGPVAKAFPKRSSSVVTRLRR